MLPLFGDEKHVVVGDVVVLGVVLIVVRAYLECYSPIVWALSAPTLAPVKGKLKLCNHLPLLLLSLSLSLSTLLTLNIYPEFSIFHPKIKTSLAQAMIGPGVRF